MSPGDNIWNFCAIGWSSYAQVNESNYVSARGLLNYYSSGFYKNFLNKILYTSILFMIVADDGFNHDGLQGQAANKWWTICSDDFYKK